MGHTIYLLLSLQSLLAPEKTAEVPYCQRQTDGMTQHIQKRVSIEMQIEWERVLKSADKERSICVLG